MEFLQSLINSLPGVLGQGLIWGLMAMGVYITFRVLDVADLTVDGTLGFGGAVCVLLTLNGVNVWLATLIAMLAGMLAGLVTGLFHTKCGIPAILAGILTQLALYSINLRVMGWGTTAGTQATLAISVDKYDLILSSRYVRDLGENIWQNPIIIMIPVTAAVVALLWWYFKTEHGSALRATGANRQMARAQGINTSTATVVGLMISNGMVGLAGGLLAQYQGSSSVDMGRGAIVIGLAAVIIGEVLLRGHGKVLAGLIGCTVGSIVYYFVIQIVLRLGLGTNDLKLFTALIVALFLAVPYWKGKAAAARRRAASPRRIRTMLELKNVSKTFNPGTINAKTALSGLDLRLNDGDFVTVIGGNGAGKSTMLNAIAGVFEIDGGSISIDGEDITRQSEHKRAAMHRPRLPGPHDGHRADHDD